MSTTTYVMEMNDRLPGYARIHRAGCRDVHDGMPVTGTTIRSMVCGVWPEYENDAPEDFKGFRAPCASDVPLSRSRR